MKAEVGVPGGGSGLSNSSVTLQLSQDGSEDTEEINNAAVHKEKPPDKFITEKVVDATLLKATDLPYNPNIAMPRGLGQAELDIQSFKRDALRDAERCRRKSKKWSNLDEQKQRGLKKLGMRVKNKQIVCFTADKSGQWS